MFNFSKFHNLFNLTNISLFANTTKPLVLINSTLTVDKNTKDVINKVLCADNYDRHIKCEIIGDYDETVIGETNLKVKAVDSSNNITEKERRIEGCRSGVDKRPIQIAF